MCPFCRIVRLIIGLSLAAAAVAGCREHEETRLTAPQLNLSQPAEGARFSEGDTIAFRAVGAQAEEGPLLAGFRAEYSPPGSEDWSIYRSLDNLAAGEFLYVDTLLAPADSGLARWRFALWNENDDTIQIERAYTLDPDTL